MTARNEFELGADERIWEEVRDRLMRHPDLDVTDVEIEVEEAEVTLAGPGWTAGRPSGSPKR